MKYIIAIDQGTTSTRSILFDELCNVVAVDQMEISLNFPKNGWVEQNPEEIWQTVYLTIKDVINKSNIDIKDIKGIGITNQRETTILWDKNTGESVYPAIVWQSRQSQSICESMIEKGYQKMIQEKTGLIINPYFSASKIKFIFDKQPHLLEKAKNGEILFGNVDSYLVWKLTSGKVHVTDYSNASRTLLYNINDLKWDEDLLELFNIPKKYQQELLLPIGYIDRKPSILHTKRKLIEE